jgi:putative ABC transport system substrate-binding protein
MKRRIFLASSALSAIAGDRSALAQAKPRIGYLSGRSHATDAHLLGAVREGLKSVGYVDGQNVVMDVRWGDGRYSEMPRMATELVATHPDVIIAVGGNPVGLAAKAATSTIPVVFIAGADPVMLGLVKSLNRPEGNLTGMTLHANQLDAKRIELLHDLLPTARKVAVMQNPANTLAAEELVRTRQAGTALGLQLEVLNAASTREIESAFQAISAAPVDALAVCADAFLINSRARILALAAERRLPAIYPAREFAVDGGLVSYGTRWSDVYRVAGTYAGRILKGAKPAELPVQQPTSYELVLNIKTARILGLSLPPIIITRADEVIE